MRSYLYTILLVILINTTGYSQNRSYNIIRDSIDPIISTNYTQAKKIFLSVEKEYNVDPYEKLFFLKSALQNGDVKYFKKEIKVLIKKYGYRFSGYVNVGQEVIFEVVNQNDLTDWMRLKSEKLYPKWVAENPRAFEIQKIMDELVVADQRRKYMLTNDTNCIEVAVNNLYNNDLDNYHQLFLLWDEEHFLPNNFEQGLGTTQKWELILWHLLKSDNHESIWKDFLPHLERLYFAGKIGDSIFRDYDYILATWFGYQYYGFQGDVPVKDIEHLEERRKKYGF